MTYEIFNDVLLELREEYHKSGSIDDSNKKLDEIIKLITLKFYDLKNNTNYFSLEYIQKFSEKNFGTKDRVALSLKRIFEDIVTNRIFFDNSNNNIFGTEATLLLSDDEDLFAVRLVEILGKLDIEILFRDHSVSGFDIINEMFGHFIRENFRNNKEDAQYMTPKEIVDPFVNIIIHEIKNDSHMMKVLFSKEPFFIMDPTCGVGTLMIEVLRGLIRFVEQSDKSDEIKNRTIAKLKNSALIGQDKVARMVMFAKINAMFMGCSFDNITPGNSILPGSLLDRYTGKIDIIFTNPPFGAAYNNTEINLGNYPIINTIQANKIDSEFLLLDRSLNLLKQGGILAIIVPDSVVSAKGFATSFREQLIGLTEILGVVDLPSETFAQAGTRTKSSVILLKKNKITKNIFMGICNNIGYIVKNRKGVPVKKVFGENDLVKISEAYIRNKSVFKESLPTKVVSQTPSSVFVNREDLIESYLTANFYDAQRIELNNAIDNSGKKYFDYIPLHEVAVLDSKNRSRKRLMVSETVSHISLLHVNSKQFTLDLQEVREFNPISKGIQCYAGEILFAKLNPRIKRMVVVPNFDNELVCSNEFEIMKPINGYDPYEILLMLDSPVVSKQINSLTSGTSSSHNRIKQEQLLNIKVPVPITHEGKVALRESAKKFKEAISQAYDSQKTINMIVKIFE